MYSMTSNIKMASAQVNGPDRPHPPSTLNNREPRTDKDPCSLAAAPHSGKQASLFLGVVYYSLVVVILHRTQVVVTLNSDFSITRTVKYNWVSRKFQQN